MLVSFSTEFKIEENNLTFTELSFLWVDLKVVIIRDLKYGLKML